MDVSGFRTDERFQNNQEQLNVNHPVMFANKELVRSEPDLNASMATVLKLLGDHPLGDLFRIGKDTVGHE